MFKQQTYVCTPPFASKRQPKSGRDSQLRRAPSSPETLGHEAPLMRQLGIHFGSLNIVATQSNAASNGEGPDSRGDYYRACPFP